MVSWKFTFGLECTTSQTHDEKWLNFNEKVESSSRSSIGNKIKNIIYQFRGIKYIINNLFRLYQVSDSREEIAEI